MLIFYVTLFIMVVCVCVCVCKCIMRTSLGNMLTGKATATTIIIITKTSKLCRNKLKTRKLYDSGEIFVISKQTS